MNTAEEGGPVGLAYRTAVKPQLCAVGAFKVHSVVGFSMLHFICSPSDPQRRVVQIFLGHRLTKFTKAQATADCRICERHWADEAVTNLRGDTAVIHV